MAKINNNQNKLIGCFDLFSEHDHNLERKKKTFSPESFPATCRNTSNLFNFQEKFS